MNSVVFCALSFSLLACRAGLVPEGTLRIKVQAGAQGLMRLYVDERPIPYPPEVAAVDLTLPVGPHRIEVRAEGHFPSYAEATVEKGLRKDLAVVLRPDPDATP